MTIIPIPIPMPIHTGNSGPLPAGSGKMILIGLIVAVVFMAIGAIIGKTKYDEGLIGALVGLISFLLSLLVVAIIAVIIQSWG